MSILGELKGPFKGYTCEIDGQEDIQIVEDQVGNELDPEFIAKILNGIPELEAELDQLRTRAEEAERERDDAVLAIRDANRFDHDVAVFLNTHGYIPDQSMYPNWVKWCKEHPGQGEQQ